MQPSQSQILSCLGFLRASVTGLCHHSWLIREIRVQLIQKGASQLQVKEGNVAAK